MACAAVASMPENAATRARFSKMHDFYAKKQRLIGELGALEIRSFGDDSVTVALTALPGDSVIAEALAVKLSFESDSTTLVNASVEDGQQLDITDIVAFAVMRNDVRFLLREVRARWLAAAANSSMECA